MARQTGSSEEIAAILFPFNFIPALSLLVGTINPQGITNTHWYSAAHRHMVKPLSNPGVHTLNPASSQQLHL